MLKKLFTFYLFLIIFSSLTLAFDEDNLSAIEYNKYGTTYPYESLGERLNRLETDYFGMSQTGDIQNRIANLSKINSNTRNSAIISDNYSNDKPKNKLRTFWENIKSNGFMTGFTPSLNTMTTQGYSNDIYNNELYNSLNQPGFCPYDINNRNSFFRNPNYYNNRLNRVNRYMPRHRFNNHQQYYRHNPYYNRYNQPYINRTTYNMPPNIETKSSIHILKD